MKITARGETTLLELLIEKTGSSKNNIIKLIKEGAASVNGRPAPEPGLRVRPGQVVEFAPKERAGKPKKAPFRILYEDQHIIAAHKPAGVLSIATEKEKVNTFYRQVSDYVKSQTGGAGRIFIVHRLDREVSGVIVFAKSDGAKRNLQKNWEKAAKVYHALVEGRPPQKKGTVESYLCESAALKVYICPPDKKDAKYAVTHYRVLKELPKGTLVEIRIETGRKHQIRVHMAQLGCPVMGDKKYGTPEKGPARLALHATALEFEHPVTGKKVKVHSPLRPTWGLNEGVKK